MRRNFTQRTVGMKAKDIITFPLTLTQSEVIARATVPFLLH